MGATPFFIVSSGRSGTAMLHKVLGAKTGVEMHHEYAVAITQPLAVKRYLGLIDEKEARIAIEQSFGAAIHYSRSRLWGDSSNKLSWLIPDLAALFPAARFVHLVRDGRKVAGSYFRKLGGENYDDRSNTIMQAFYDGEGHMPPPEKPYWWPLPSRGSPQADAFRSFDQFQRICWHWAEINQVIVQSLSTLPRERTLFVRLEELVRDPAQVQRLMAFLSLDYCEKDFAAFAHPHNVNRPQDQLLSDIQRRQFEAIAAPVMTMLGYGSQAEYVVNY